MHEIDLQIDDFMLECTTRGLSKKTINSYESTIRLLAEYLQNDGLSILFYTTFQRSFLSLY